LIGSTLMPPAAELTLPMMWKMGSIGSSALGWHASGSARASSARPASETA